MSVDELAREFIALKSISITRFDDILSDLKVLHDRIDKRDREIQDLQSRVDKIEGRQSGIRWLIGLAFPGIAAIAAVVALLMK